MRSPQAVRKTRCDPSDRPDAGWACATSPHPPLRAICHAAFPRPRGRLRGSSFPGGRGGRTMLTSSLSSAGWEEARCAFPSQLLLVPGTYTVCIIWYLHSRGVPGGGQTSPLSFAVHLREAPSSMGCEGAPASVPEPSDANAYGQPACAYMSHRRRRILPTSEPSNSFREDLASSASRSGAKPGLPSRLPSRGGTSASGRGRPLLSAGTRKAGRVHPKNRCKRHRKSDRKGDRKCVSKGQVRNR